MKRTHAVLVGGVALLWMALGVCGTASAWPNKKADAKPAEQKAQAAPAQPAAQPAAPAAEAPADKVAYTFEDEGKMKEFAALWQQHQLLLLRMRALQSYFDDDQRLLGEINKKFTADYKVDMKKSYYLDPKRRVLLERETPPAAAAPAGLAGPADQPAGTPAQP